MAGSARTSRMVELVASEDPDSQMPPQDRPRLSSREIAVLQSWIDGGLRWEEGVSFAAPRYEPPLKPRRPTLPQPTAGRDHPIDRIVDDYFRQHQIQRPKPISDAAFLRRVSLDIVGLLPAPERREQFLADPSSAKRERLVRELLEDELAYAEHWLTFWNDLLRNDYSGTGFITGGRKQISAWLYRSLVDNKPYDQFVRELIDPTEESDGFIRGIRWRGDVNASQTQEIQFAQNISQAFLGINLKCASCHDSFIDRWTLEETYGLAQVYATQPLMLHRCDKPLDKQVSAAWLFPELGTIDPQASQPDRLQQLAALMTHPENGRFTRTIVNRLWHRLMGRGVVHPVDAMHTEPWSADLLDYLAVHLADNGYDLKKTIELICTSEIYQGATLALEQTPDGNAYVFRGPLARRMTAEQFLDAVWRITEAAPPIFDAPVLRLKQVQRPAATTGAAPVGKWVWAYPDASRAVPARETITLRRQFTIDAVPRRAVTALTCDNEYQLFVNDRLVHSDENWETVEVIDLAPHLRRGRNQIVLAAKNAGNGPNPAAVFLEMRLRYSDNAEDAIGTDGEWQWTSAAPDRRGQFAKEPSDWQAAAIVQSPRIWSRRVKTQIVQALSSAAESPLVMVRASLMKNNAFLTALGRPTRDQIVSMRPADLTTLEAIDLANGQILADAIAHGARRATAQYAEEPLSLTRWLFTFALSREPTPDEERLALALLGARLTEQNVEDLMWSLFMLPEFQLVR